ncbi:MAG: three-Cys-motif partner protein TcmP [Acidobacteria bacterium]|nr:three-Cys-motif partner protein TcmP [Acidobacteriota bacterium]
MAPPKTDLDKPFGGSWTKEKLDILQRYLDAYTTALKNKPFQLWYIDAFAGTGDVQLRRPEDGAEAFLAGSARRALAVGDRPFDRLIFIERHPERCIQLSRLRSEHPGRDVRIENAEANSYLRSLTTPRKPSVRGVLFLDPFATQLVMSTLKHIAGLQRFDTWILFPVSAISRLLPRWRKPDDISPKWVERLNQVYGGDSWRGLYRPDTQQNLFGPADSVRKPGVADLTRIYRKRLSEAFGSRLLADTAELRNSRGSVLFELIFCVGHPRGIGPAKNIAAHLLKDI